jgi:hypothetical protein
MIEDEKKEETEVTPEGAVEVKEEDLDQASGGAAYLKMPVDRLSSSDTSQKFSPTLKPLDANYDLKKL